MSQSAVALSKHMCLQQHFKMFVADVKWPKAAWQTVPNLWADSAKASVSKAVVRTWYRTHVIRGRPKGWPVPYASRICRRQKWQVITMFPCTLHLLASWHGHPCVVHAWSQPTLAIHVVHGSSSHSVDRRAQDVENCHTQIWLSP